MGLPGVQCRAYLEKSWKGLGLVLVEHGVGSAELLDVSIVGIVVEGQRFAIPLFRMTLAGFTVFPIRLRKRTGREIRVCRQVSWALFTFSGISVSVRPMTGEGR